MCVYVCVRSCVRVGVCSKDQHDSLDCFAVLDDDDDDDGVVVVVSVFGCGCLRVCVYVCMYVCVPECVRVLCIADGTQA